MKYYSELLRKTYDEASDCLKAEKEYSEKLEAEKKKEEELRTQRAVDAKDVEAKLEACVKARKEYAEALHNFTQKYGQYHYTIRDNTASLYDIFDMLF